MSSETLKVEESSEYGNRVLKESKPSEESYQKNKFGLKPFIPFTEKWRVKLYILNQNGEWDDKGIGYVFLANEYQDQRIEANSEKIYSSQIVKKLMMIRENTQEFIFNIDIIKDNLEFHNQRGTILTWKNEDIFEEDNIAISFQLKEGITEIFKNIKIIKGETVQEDDVFLEEESPFEILENVTKEDLPNILRELPSDMEESKINDFTTYLEMTNCNFIKKLGKLLISEEKKKEEIKSALSLNSQETDVSLNINKNNGKETINEITEKIINMGDGEKKFDNKCDIEPMIYNENVNYIYNIFKNMILYGNRTLLEILFDDDNYLITFGALEYEPQSNIIIPHRKYFKEIVKFKNPLNIQDPLLIERINQNLRLTYLRDTALGRIINENTNKTINLIIQMNHTEIIQFFINNTNYLNVLFSQMKSENIDVKKDAILFLSELIACSKNVVQSRVTFNEVLCQNGILPLLSKLIEENTKENNKNNNSISELININIVEIFISILSSVPLLIRQYLVDNEGQTLDLLRDLLLFHGNFPIKYEISQIFKTLIEGDGDPSKKQIFFGPTIDKLISYLNNPYSKTNNKNEISTTIQIIIEIFLTWFNNMDFDSQLWLEKHKINLIIIQLLKDKSKIVNLYAIKLLKLVLDTCENYLAIKIINVDLCNILINLFKENMKKHNILFSCLMNFFDSVSLSNNYVLNTIMVYCEDFVYENKDIFQNIISRYERKPLPKRKLAEYLMRTYTDGSLGQITMLKNFEDCKSNEVEEFNYNENLFGNEEDCDDELDELNEKIINTTNLNCFSCIENNDINKMMFLKRKRKIQRNDEDKFMKYFDDEDEDDEEEKKINDKFDDIYDDLILKKGEQNNKERSFQYHGNEDGDLSGIYLQEDEFAD